MRLRGLLFLLVSSCLFAEGEQACHKVGGGISTNFVDAVDTLGSATGDLAGGLGVHVIGQEAGPNGSIVLTVHHHWVTVTGDTVSLDEAKATLFPTPVPGFYAAIYLDGVNVNGSGTGKLAGASGKIHAWGAVDLNKMELTLRYSGQICHNK
ncbi:MAG TPA: hypothetical protein VKX25_08785 [Bryobacteraceae bacterium]|jgi:hypothetical protein|nr:hypothetical protein [Bryobacteraceae bacterium]